MESHDQHCVHAMMVLPCLVVALTQPRAPAADDMLAQSRGPAQFETASCSEAVLHHALGVALAEPALACRYWTGERVMKRTWPYDMWSLGVTWLEIVMGTPHVFQVDPRTRAKLYHQLNMEAMSEVSGPRMPEISKVWECGAAGGSF